MTVKSIFHAISYLQYPLVAIAMYFAFRPYFGGLNQLGEKSDLIFEGINNALIFFGLALSFSTLQDTSKTQNNFSNKRKNHFSPNGHHGISSNNSRLGRFPQNRERYLS